MYINRVSNISEKLERKSQFLFGPRQTGKSSYIAYELTEKIALRIDLLNNRERTKLMSDPGRLYEEVEALSDKEGIVVIDEIQKVPALLDEVHRLIEEKGRRFLLTGSSARKLVRSGTNLLGGRAGRSYLFPFVYPEIKDKDYTLEHIFSTGLLPAAYLSEDVEEVLEDYIDVYLYDEIQGEGAVRNLPAFSRFLEVAALTNGSILNFTNVSSDVGLSKTSIREWYQILVDTLLGFELQPFRETKIRKAIETAKFYLFDVGILKTLLHMALPVETQSEFGLFFETFIINELNAYLNYSGKIRKHPLSFWRSTSGFEVDLIIGKEVAIELKSAKNLIPRDFRGLKAFKEENICKKHLIVCREDQRRLVDGIYYVYPWKEFLKDLWADEII